MLWPFPIDWNTDPVVRLEWLTDVTVSRDDNEQRFAMRDGARRFLQCSVIARDNDERMRLTNALVANQANVYQVPWTLERAMLTATAPAATRDVYVDSTAQFSNGQRVALIHELQSTIAQIDAVFADRVRLVDALSSTWPLGTSVAPVVNARVDMQQELNALTDAVLLVDVRFSVETEWNIPVIEPADYRGYRVFTQQTAWNDGVTLNVSRNLAQFDPKFIAPVYRDLNRHSRRTRSHQFIAATPAEVTALLEFLAARRGRYHPFWIPTNQNDFELLQDVGATETNILVKNRLHSMALGQPGANFICIKSTDGSRFFRRITGIAVLSNEQELVTIDAPLNTAIANTNVEIVSYLHFVRLASDGIELQYKTDSVLLCRVGLIAIKEPA